MKTSSDLFAVFSLPPSWEVNTDQLDTRFRRLQQQFHPDHYASKSEIEKCCATKMAATINRAYQTLKNPLTRAQHLLELQGYDCTHDSQTTSDEQFLMVQMVQREALSNLRDSAKPQEALESLSTEARQSYLHLQQQFAQQYQLKNYADALATVAKMQFAAKFLDEIIEFETQLEDL